MAQVSLDLIFRGVDRGVGALQSKLGKGIRLNTQQLQRMGMVAMGAGAAILGALAAMTVAAAKYGDEIAKAAAMTNTSVEALSGLRYAADRAGVSFEDLTMSLARQSRAAREAADGVATYKDAYDRLGITVTDTQGTLKTSEELFLETADALGKLQGSQEQTALAMDIFGRSGAKLIPLFNQGSAGIEQLMARAKELGLVLDEDTARAAERFNDALADVKDSLKGVAIQVGQHIFPAIASLAEKLADAIGLFNRFADAHPYLAKMAVLATAALGGLLVVGGGLLILLAQLAPLLTAVSGAGGIAGVGAAAAGASTAIAGAGAALAGVIVTAGLFLAVAAAAAAAIYLWKRNYDVLAETADLARQSVDNFNKSQGMALKLAKERGAEGALGAQQAELRAAAPTLGERWQGMMAGGGVTARDLAQQRVFAEQAAPGAERGGTTIIVQGNAQLDREWQRDMDARVVKAGSYAR